MYRSHIGTRQIYLTPVSSIVVNCHKWSRTGIILQSLEIVIPLSASLKKRNWKTYRPLCLTICWHSIAYQIKVLRIVLKVCAVSSPFWAIHIWCQFFPHEDCFWLLPLPCHYQRFVSSIGNIENAVWVFNCLGSPAGFGSAEKNIGGRLWATFEAFFSMFSGSKNILNLFWKCFSICSKQLHSLHVRKNWKKFGKYFNLG